MKVLASDFDGTFHLGEGSIPKNIAAVRRWQQEGLEILPPEKWTEGAPRKKGKEKG